MLFSCNSIKSYIAFLAGIKPRYSCYYSPSKVSMISQHGEFYISRYPKAVKSITVISADFEMAWAWQYAKVKPASPTEMGLRERSNFPVFLTLFNSYDIPVTWATVGHLFLDNCCNNGSFPHSTLPRIPFFSNNHWTYSSGDWFQHDPCTNYKIDPAWYAPDLIMQLIDSHVKHEIACHSFSHLDMTDLQCPYDVAKSEIELCISVAKGYNVSLRSMVFPGGTRGHFEVLKDLGFTSYRGRPEPNIELNYPTKSAYNLWVLPTATIVGGMLSQNYNPSIANWMLSKYLSCASANNLVAHFWFHPSCDNTTTEILFPNLVKEIARRRDIGEICVMTMDSLADYCETRLNSRIEIVENGFIIHNTTQNPFRKTPLTMCFANGRIAALLSDSGNSYKLLKNNGVYYAEIPSCEFGLRLTYLCH